MLESACCRSQPTYEDLKLIPEVSRLPGEAGGSQPTYEDLKLNAGLDGVVPEELFAAYLRGFETRI